MAQRHRDPHTERCTRTIGGDLQPDQAMQVHWFEGGFGLLYDRMLTKRVQHGPVPTHVAIIMDGHRRFALAGGMPKQDGHRLGKDKVREVMRWCRSLGLRWGWCCWPVLPQPARLTPC